MPHETESTRWSPETSLALKGVGPARVSPNGKRAAYTVSKPVMTDDKSEFVAQIWLADTEGTEAYQATFGEKSAENPRWSPDGARIGFTSKRGEKNRLYVIRLSGGEAEPLTDDKHDVGDYRWSPDGQQIAVLMTDKPDEEEEKRNKAKDDWTWKDENHKFTRLYVVDVEARPGVKREPRLLTHADRQVGTFDWSPDGLHIAYDHTESPSADHWPTSAISVVDVATAESTPVVQGSFAAIRPFYSPDGGSIAYAQTDDPPRWYFASRIHVLSLSGSQPKVLPATFDENPALVGWSADGMRIYFQEPYHTTVRLYSIPVGYGETEVVYSGGANAEFNLNATRTWFGFAHQTVEQAVEAFASPLDHPSARPVSSANSGEPRPSVSKTEIIHWMGVEGKEIEALLTFPAGYKPGKRVPLLLVIHGGPAGVFSESFPGNASMYPVAAFAERGFAVLRCNPRGSSGYGASFRSANVKDWGGRDFKDLMAGVDRVIEKGIADPDRLGVMGWSYGGFMTSWVITQTHRFKAASVGAAVTNLASFNGTADIPSFVPDYFGGEFWENPEIYVDHSPLFQARGVTTPALIQHGDADIRVPISQGYEYYNALKRQGVETRMIVFPRQPHGLTEPRMVLKAMQTNLEWFADRLR